MARWKLTEAHYLNVEGTRWEYTEVDRRTGSPKRTQFPVPLLLDPKSLDDLKRYGQTDPEYPSNDIEDRIIVVAQGQTSNAADIVFSGKVTPGMLPLDADAKRITAESSNNKWLPTQGLDDESQNKSYTNQLLSGFIDEMSSLKASVTSAPQVAGMDQFMQSMTDMMKMQTEILAKLADKPERRV